MQPPPIQFQTNSRHSPTSLRGYRVAPMSFAVIEEKAIQILPELPKVTDNPHRLDCQRILERYLDIKGYIYGTDNSEENPKLKNSAAYIEPEEKVIVMREDVYNLLFEDHPYARHTVLHELGHIALKHIVTLDRGIAPLRHPIFEDTEWQADTYAAALHIPLDLCRTTQSIAEISRLTGASKDSIMYRLDNLKRHGLI